VGDEYPVADEEKMSGIENGGGAQPHQPKLQIRTEVTHIQGVGLRVPSQVVPTREIEEAAPIRKEGGPAMSGLTSIFAELGHRLRLTAGRRHAVNTGDRFRRKDNHVIVIPRTGSASGRGTDHLRR